MCSSHDRSAGFVEFCVNLHRWLSELPQLDPSLAAAAELLDRRATWFECELSHTAFNSEDVHSALGAGVVLSLWNASQSGRFILPIPN